MITPLEGIESRAGSNCTVYYEDGSDLSSAMKYAAYSDVAIVCNLQPKNT